jgi:hypothetical protein
VLLPAAEVSTGDPHPYDASTIKNQLFLMSLFQRHRTRSDARIVEPPKRCRWQIKRGGERKKQGELQSEPTSRATMFLTGFCILRAKTVLRYGERVKALRKNNNQLFLMQIICHYEKRYEFKTRTSFIFIVFSLFAIAAPTEKIKVLCFGHINRALISRSVGENCEGNREA